MYRLFIDYNNVLEEIKGINDGGLIIASNDPLNFSPGKAFKTYSINIPNIGRNNLLLDNLFNKNFNKTLVYDTYLILDDFLQFKGKLFVYGHNKYYADTQFITATGVLWEELGDKSIKYDFDHSELDHVLNQTTVNSSFSGRLRYDFINRGNGLYVNDGMNWSPTGVLKNVDIAERQPAIQVKYLVDKIFSEYQVFNEFMDNVAYNNLYMLYTQNQTRNSEGWVDFAKASGNRTGPGNFVAAMPIVGSFREINFITDHFNEVNNLDFDGIRYTVPETGTYRFWGKIYCGIDLDSPSHIGWWRQRQYNIRISEYQGGTFIRNILSYTVSKPDAIPNPQGRISDFIEVFEFDSKLIELQAGRYIYLNIGYRNFATDLNNDAIIPPPPQTIRFQANFPSFLRVEPWNGMGFGSTVPGEWCVPDIKVIDFLAMILKHFNVEMYSTNIDVKRLYLTNRNTNIPESYDITEYIIADSIQIEENANPKNYEISFTTDSNDKFAEQQNNIGFSDGSVFIDSGSKETQIIKSDISKNYIRTTEPTVIQMLNDIEEPTYSTSFNTRLAYYVGTLPFSWRRHAAGNTGNPNPSATVTTGIPNFSNSYDFYNEHLVFNQGLYDRNFKGNIDRLQAGGIITCDMKIDTIFLNDIYYILGRDLRANYAIRIPGFEGFYQLISLNKKGKDIYTCKLFRVLVYDDTIPQPDPPCKDFNNDFNNDYGCGLPLAPTFLSYVDITGYTGDSVTSTPSSDVFLFNFVINKPLPSGLTLNQFTGVISGIPTVTVDDETYAITANNYDGSIVATFKIDIQPPPVVITPVITGNTISDQSLYISWDDIELPTAEFKIERSLNNIDFTEIGSVTYPTSGFTDSGLTYDETYYYRVRVFYNFSYYDYSNVVQLKTSKCNLTLNAVVETGTTIELSIDYGCFTVFNTIDVYRDNTYLKTIPANSTGFTDNVPDPDFANIYRIEMNHNNSKLIVSNNFRVNDIEFKMLIEVEEEYETVYIYRNVAVYYNDNVSIDPFPNPDPNGDISMPFDFKIDWGDGTVETFSGTTFERFSHTYITPDYYVVKISGDFPICDFYNYNDEIIYEDFDEGINIVDIESWGKVDIFRYRFFFQTFETFSAVNSPNFMEDSMMDGMFSLCVEFNDDISHWDVSNVVNMYATFAACLSFNQPLNDWDVSNVVTMLGMFEVAYDFNQPLNNWDVSNVENMAAMFSSAESFNQNISGWNTINVQNMAWMFSSAESFNQNISGWNTINVQNMDGMFSYAESFNQDLSLWCVPNFVGQPNNFDLNATSWTLPRPDWGSCP